LFALFNGSKSGDVQCGHSMHGGCVTEDGDHGQRQREKIFYTIQNNIIHYINLRFVNDAPCRLPE